jgi:hypothetical protein
VLISKQFSYKKAVEATKQKEEKRKNQGCAKVTSVQSTSVAQPELK